MWRSLARRWNGEFLPSKGRPTILGMIPIRWGSQKDAERVVDIADEGGEPAFFAFEQAGDRSGVALWRLAERQK